MFSNHLTWSTFVGPWDQRRVRDDVLAQHVLELLAVAPVLRITVPQPEDAGRDVRRNVLYVLGVYGVFAVGRHENFCCFIVIADGAV
jgi:hypothetical protein